VLPIVIEIENVINFFLTIEDPNKAPPMAPAFGLYFKEAIYGGTKLITPCFVLSCTCFCMIVILTS
jgi:hypothetical protein